MDRGELFKKEFSITPASNGGFIVCAQAFDAKAQTLSVAKHAFTSLDDLMNWLNDQRPVEDLKKQADAAAYATLGGLSHGHPLQNNFSSIAAEPNPHGLLAVPAVGTLEGKMTNSIT